jgi:hypothetical protein
VSQLIYPKSPAFSRGFFWLGDALAAHDRRALRGVSKGAKNGAKKEPGRSPGRNDNFLGGAVAQ